MGRLLDAKEMEDTTESTWLSLGSGALDTTVLGASGRAGISPFEGVHLRPNYREGTQPLPPTENWIKDLLSLPLPIRTRPSFPLSQSLPSGSFYKPLIFSIRGQTE